MFLGMDTGSYHQAAGLGEWRPRQTPPMRLEHFYRKAVELNLQGVAISDLRLLERADYGYLSSCRRAAEAAGLFLQLTYAGFRADNLQDAVRLAGATGCRSLCFRPTLERPLPVKTMQVRLEELCDMLAQALPVMARYSVNVALAGNGGLTAEDMLSIYEALNSEYFTFCLDPASALLVLEDPVEWAQQLGPYTSSVRLSDYEIVADSAGARLFGCCLGAGIVKIPELLEAIRRGSPSARLFIATSGGSLPLPFLDTVFLERLHHLRPAQLAGMMRLLMEQGLENPPLLQFPDLSEDEVLAAEDERFQSSLEWLCSLLEETQSDVEAEEGAAE